MTGFYSSLQQANDEAAVSKLKKNNWKGFGENLVANAIWTLIYAFFACNFVYISRSKLDKVFPTNCHAAPYDGNYDNPIQAIDYFSPDKFTFPYNLGPPTSTEGISYDIKNWFFTSIRFAYTNGRMLIKAVMSLMRSLGEMASGTPGAGKGGDNVAFISSFLLVPLFLYGSFFGGFFLTMLGQFYDGEHVFFRFMQGLLGMFCFGIGPTIAGSVGFIQFLQTAITFTLLPFFQDRPKLLSIIGNNKKLILVVFGYLVLRNAADTLPELPQWPMWLVYILAILIPTMFGKKAKTEE